TISGNVPFALSADAVIVAVPAETAVMTPFWSIVATAVLLELHCGVRPETASPWEFKRRAVTVIVAPTCMVGDGATTTTAVTGVGDGAEGASMPRRTRC